MPSIDDFDQEDFMGKQMQERKHHRGSNGSGYVNRPKGTLSRSNEEETKFAVKSDRSQDGEDEFDQSRFTITMRHIYAKSQFKKICNRMREDSSSIWYDHQERELLDYEEVKRVY